MTTVSIGTAASVKHLRDALKSKERTQTKRCLAATGMVVACLVLLATATLATGLKPSAV